MVDSANVRVCTPEEQWFAWNYAWAYLDSKNYSIDHANFGECLVSKYEKKIVFSYDRGINGIQNFLLSRNNGTFALSPCRTKLESCFSPAVSPEVKIKKAGIASLPLLLISSLLTFSGCLSAPRMKEYPDVGVPVPETLEPEPTPDLPTSQDTHEYEPRTEPAPEPLPESAPEPPPEPMAEPATEQESETEPDLGIEPDSEFGAEAEFEEVTDIPSEEIKSCLPSELCDNLDNDCDGITDNLPSLGESCETEGRGICKTTGKLTCDPAISSALFCKPDIETTPQEEICNDLDDNCNGITDDVKGIGELCKTEDLGICQTTGTIVCDPFVSAELFCKSEDVILPKDEICNGLDDNCNGLIDEPGLNITDNDEDGLCDQIDPDIDGDDINNESDNCPMVYNPDQVDENKNLIGDACETDFDNDGVHNGDDNCPKVYNPGQEDADLNGVGDVCDLEYCNGIDDDSDGLTDEGFPNLGNECSAGTGICFSLGHYVCNDTQDAAICSAVAKPPKEIDLCNGLDDNCDGKTDENFTNLGEECSIGSGICYSVGKYVCSSDQLTTVCDAKVIPPKAESCNGLDDNCNGLTDEGFNVGSQCEIGIGACKVIGKFICDAGLAVCDGIPNNPLDEICNGLDDNCDGVVDDGFNVGGQCKVGIGACERSGKIYCLNGKGACDATPGESSQEKCNGIDDDCNGVVDIDTFKNLGGNCSIGEGICKSLGKYICSNDQLSVKCNATVIPPQTEICDGLDNNCNGKTDEIGGSVKDTDGDGICDEQDSDLDGDGVLNTKDNCKYVANADQKDLNKNGVGNACDGSPCSGLMKLFTYYKSPETPAQACATTPKMYVVSINGVKPTDSGWHAFVNKNNTNQKVSFTTNCLDEKESTFNPDIPTWNQSVIMNWYTSTSGTMVGRMWFSGDTTSYKNRLYKNKQDTQQEYGYPQYDTDVLYNCP